MPIHGLEDFRKLVNNLKNLEAETQKTLIREVSADSEQIAQINRDYAILTGERPDGKEIQPRGYSSGYARWKRAYATHKNTAFVDLYRYGYFWESVKFEHVSGNVWKLYSTGVSHAADLFARYGKLIGIRAKDMQGYAQEILKPKLIDDIKRQLKR